MPNRIRNYEAFFSNWLNHSQNLLHQLLHPIASETPNNTALQLNLTGQVLSHYTLYYQEKETAAKREPFLFMNPPWLSALERTLLWLGDFKPSLIFMLISKSVADLTPEQSERIERLVSDTRREERKLTEAMAEIQEGLASPPIYSLARRSHRLINGEVSEMEEGEKALEAAMLTILERADDVRRSMAANAVEILSPSQAVRFLATAIDFQLRLRRWGQLRDRERTSTANVDGRGVTAGHVI